MPKIPLPADSKAYAELAFREKEKWHRRQARMSFACKLEVLDELRQRGKILKELRLKNHEQR